MYCNKRFAELVSVPREDVGLRVQDDGFGITPELLPRIFELFVQDERTLIALRACSGIGLASVRRLLQLHGGNVAVHSAGANCGSVFTVRLPAVAAVGTSAKKAGRGFSFCAPKPRTSRSST